MQKYLRSKENKRRKWKLKSLHLDPRNGLRPILDDNFKDVSSPGLVGADNASMWTLLVSRLPAIFICFRFQFNVKGFVVIAFARFFFDGFSIARVLLWKINRSQLSSMKKWTRVKIQIQSNEVCKSNWIRERCATRPSGNWLPMTRLMRHKMQWANREWIDCDWVRVMSCNSEARARWKKKQTKRDKWALQQIMQFLLQNLSFGLILNVNGFVFTLGIGHEEI